MDEDDLEIECESTASFSADEDAETSSAVTPQSCSRVQKVLLFLRQKVQKVMQGWFSDSRCMCLPLQCFLRTHRLYPVLLSFSDVTTSEQLCYF